MVTLVSPVVEPEVGLIFVTVGSGGIALVDQAYPKSIHVAYPGSDYQVEVFSPSPARTRQVVVSGQVAAVR